MSVALRDTMIKPPFKIAVAVSAAHRGAAVSGARDSDDCCAGGPATDEPVPHGRRRLWQLPLFMHCSVLGTCISTAELRKVAARYTDIERERAGDLEVHNTAVTLAKEAGPAAKAIHKALDHRHELAIRKFSKAHDPKALRELWDEARRTGEIPGAYWALLTHPDLTDELRNAAFGDVHMLSHLVGAANRADIRRLMALEAENAELRERLERQQDRVQELVEERDRAVQHAQQALALAAREQCAGRAADGTANDLADLRAALEAETRQVALQTARREKAEQQASEAEVEVRRLQGITQELRDENDAQRRELAAAEAQLEHGCATGDEHAAQLEAKLRGQRVLYVGGRPGSIPSIRKLVALHGGELLHHDGGLEDRKGLLASAIQGARLAVFPVDCIDHDSAGKLKRLCIRHGIPFVPLRSASIASFIAAMSGEMIAESSKI
jgi:hypothetical protein